MASEPIRSPFASAASYAAACEWIDYRGVRFAARFSDLAAELAAVEAGPVLVDRTDRGLIEVTGKDRKTWLHNLVTNAVKTLDDGAGNYAFAIDVRGRTIFDLNILALPDSLWLDVDRSMAGAAIAHLNKFLITEDAKMVDRSAEFARLGVTGAGVDLIAPALGAGNFVAMPALASTWAADGGARFVRHDFAGRPGFELIIPVDSAAGVWERLVGLGVRPIGFEALDVLRIGAGIPWIGRDIDEKTIPPETGQIERGISYHKGCYLGQEVIERMRSHGTVARRLVKIQIAGRAAIATPADIKQGEAAVGRLTSLAFEPVAGKSIGLGYVRTALKDLTGLRADDSPLEVAGA